MVSDEQSQAFLSVFRIIAVGTSGCCDCRYYEVIHETDLLTLRIFVCYEEYSVCQWGWFHHQGFRRCIESLRGSFLEKEGIPKKYRLQVDFDRHHYFSEHSQRKRREEKDQRARREKREKKRQEEDAQYCRRHRSISSRRSASWTPSSPRPPKPNPSSSRLPSNRPTANSRPFPSKPALQRVTHSPRCVICGTRCTGSNGKLLPARSNSDRRKSPPFWKQFPASALSSRRFGG